MRTLGEKGRLWKGESRAGAPASVRTVARECLLFVGVGCCPADFGLPLLLAPRRGASSSDRSAAEGSVRRLATRCLASRPHSLHARSTGPLVVGRERPLVLSARLFRLGDYLSGIRSRIAEPHRAVARDEIAGEAMQGRRH